MGEAKYTISELAKLAGVTVRTIRYYISEGLLPAPGTAGPGEKYDDSYLQRLELIKRLKAEYLPLEKIKELLANVGEDVIREEAGAAPPQPPMAAPDSAKEYIRNVLSPNRPVKKIQRMAEEPMFDSYQSPEPSISYLRTPVSSPSVIHTPGQVEERWLHYRICDDVELHIRERAEPHIKKHLATILRELERMCRA